MKSLEIVNKLINQSKRGMLIDNNEEELEQIKQDLEVLEILRKYLFIEKYVDSWFEIDLYEKEQKEDFNKLKQWLEENK